MEVFFSLRYPLSDVDRGSTIRTSFFFFTETLLFEERLLFLPDIIAVVLTKAVQFEENPVSSASGFTGVDQRQCNSEIKMFFYKLLLLVLFCVFHGWRSNPGLQHVLALSLSHCGQLRNGLDLSTILLVSLCLSPKTLIRSCLCTAVCLWINRPILGKAFLCHL